MYKYIHLHMKMIIYQMLDFILLFFLVECRDIKIKKDDNLFLYQLQKKNDKTLLEIYNEAVLSYLNEDWDACIYGFQNFSNKYKNYKNVIVECRRNCRIKSKTTTLILIHNIEDIHFYEKSIKETLCILKCKQEYRKYAGYNSLKKLPNTQELNVMFGEYYGYLHICYFQKNNLQEAANSVFTYLIYHPDHKPSKLSLAYYLNHQQVKNNTVRNLQAEPFIDYYINGMKAYYKEFYDEAIKNFESSITSYIQSEESCRFYCEGPIENDWNPEFIIAFSNHFVHNLYCKRRCSQFLRNLNGEYRQDFLEEHFNYLQFAYYKLHNIKKACESVANYLLFNPADETMLANKNFYASLPMLDYNYFKPREEIAAYVLRQEYEMRLLLYIQDEFTTFENELMT